MKRRCIGCPAVFVVGPRDRNPRKWCSEKCRARAVRKAARARWLASDRRKDNERRRLHSLRARYGISADDYEAMLAAQNGACALCGAEARQIKLAIDHDHGTGEIRGILCGPCNTALGRFGDSVDGVQRVLAYLENPPARKILNVRRCLEVLRAR